MPELSISEIEQGLKNLPARIHDAGQKLIEAENTLCSAQAQLDIDMAKIRIDHINDDLRAKVIESYAISGTAEQKKKVIELTKLRDLAQLEKNLNEDKYTSIRKIANVRGIYQA